MPAPILPILVFRCHFCSFNPLRVSFSPASLSTIQVIVRVKGNCSLIGCFLVTGWKLNIELLPFQVNASFELIIGLVTMLLLELFEFDPKLANNTKAFMY